MQRNWLSLTFAGLAGATGLIGGAQAAPVELSDTPLVVTSAAVEPNVMLLVDNSGSMYQIIWEEGYEPNKTYAGDFDTDEYYSTGRSDGRLRESKWSDTLYMPRPAGSSTRYDGNYLNYLVTEYGDGADLRWTVPNDYRMNVAKNVAKYLVEHTPGMRFGVSAFNSPTWGDSGPGGRIIAGCTKDNTGTVLSAINSLGADSNTPLAETYYEITRYFRGLSRYQGSGSGSYHSPIEFRCQKNFAIVITDGLPTYDDSFPDDDPDDPDEQLPDWDGISSNYGEPYSDGHGNGGEGDTLYLDDLAKFAWDIDMRTGGTDASGGSFDDPDFKKQNLATYTVGFSFDNQMLEDAAEYGNGTYFTADNEDQLIKVLQEALADIQGKISSSASVAANTGVVGTETDIYQARFDSRDWSGELLKINLDLSDSDNLEPEWNAGSLIPGHSTRKIYTLGDSGGAAFAWNSLTAAQKTALDDDSDLLNYLRGDDSEEEQNGGGFRNRSTLLGDIVNSSPLFVQTPPFRYPDVWGSGAPENSAPYSTFKADQAGTRDAYDTPRPAMVYVGANDGMLHAFNADTGVEEFAYVPSALFPTLADLADPDYGGNSDGDPTHRFYVDGSPNVGAAFFDGAWHSVLVGGLNKGGQGIYALDVTNPTTFDADDVLWEFTDADDADLGYTYSEPAIVRLHTGRWAAVFGNGYNNSVSDGNASATGNAVLFVVDIETGDLIGKIDTGVGSTTTPNGLSTPAPVDLDGDFIVDVVYAGDLYGNLWKFDLTDGEADASGNLDWSASRLFCSQSSATACNSPTGKPITVRPEVGFHTRLVPGADDEDPTTPAKRFEKGPMVLFGTGRYLGKTDIENAADNTHSFYGIFDNGEGPVLGHGSLQKQEILWEGDAGEYEVRVTSNHTMSASQRGWYMDLLPPNGTAKGEMQVSHPILRNGRIIFTTVIPSEDPCLTGGTSWLMELNARDGSRMNFPVFDVDGDGDFDMGDMVQVDFDVNGDGKVDDKDLLPPTGKKSKIGVTPTPTVVNDTQTGREYKVASGSSGGVEITTENQGPMITGRHSWRELMQ